MEINEEEIADFDSEGDFVGLSVELLIEAGSYLVAAASVYPSGIEGWTRNQAVIGGSIVRLYKLVDAILDQTCKHRLETAFILSRLHFETTVNCIYLMQNPAHEKFDCFVAYALQHEDKLLCTIEANIEERNGETLPIEERMVGSIGRMLRLSQIDRTELPAKRMRDWDNSNLFERTKAIGLERAYNPVFSGASQIVHGSWGDLYQHHLEAKGDRFVAKISFKEPRPQFLEVIAILSAKIVREFIDFLGLYLERKALKGLFDEFEGRVRRVSKLHEEFLSK